VIFLKDIGFIKAAAACPRLRVANPEYNSKDGVEISRYDKIKTASENTNIKASSISANCKGKLKSAGGFVWVYVLNEENNNI
jgi:hypothetical protein